MRKRVCTTTLLDTWVKTKEPIAAMHFSKSNLIKILRPLAFWMHSHPTVGAIPEEELLEQIEQQLLERKITRHEDEATRLAEQFLQTVRGKTGILVERGKLRYRFLHLTFEEYFAAKELAIQKKTRVEFIKQHLHEARWREVILLSIGIVGILEADEEGVTELVQDAILHANSDFEPWLYRDLLFAGLCLADDVGVSVTCEEVILQKIVNRYLTSPYNSFRTACAPVLNSWRDTPIGEHVVQLILYLLSGQAAMMNRMQPVSSTPLATKLHEQIRDHCQYMIQQGQESFIRLLRLQLIAILKQARASSTAKEWLEYALAAITDPLGQVRQAAAAVLGQVGVGDQRVVDALLKLLSEPDPYRQVYQAVGDALIILSVDALSLGRNVKEKLSKYQPINSKQFTADYVSDSLLSVLQQILGVV